MTRIIVKGTHATGASAVYVEIEEVTQADYENIKKKFRRKPKNLKISEWIANSFLRAMQICSSANPSDMWLYVFYLEYLQSIGNEQSWKRASGFAFEHVLQRFYSPILEDLGLSINVLGRKDQVELLAEFGLSHVDIPPAKLDISVRREKDRATVAVLHAKVSIAERISDDIPASRLLMQAGCASAILTFDMKHFPPPHGDGINYGELGGRSQMNKLERQYQQKRAYIEESGDFDALCSYNTRTPPSHRRTTSGKRIHTLTFSEVQPDMFVKWISGLKNRKHA